MVVRGCVTVAHGGARPCPGRDPLARPCHRYRALVVRAVERGVEKMNRRKLTDGAQQAATAGEAEGARACGWLLGLRELVGRPAAARWRGWPVAGWAVKLSRPGP